MAARSIIPPETEQEILAETDLGRLSGCAYYVRWVAGTFYAGGRIPESALNELRAQAAEYEPRMLDPYRPTEAEREAQAEAFAARVAAVPRLLTDQQLDEMPYLKLADWWFRNFDPPRSEDGNISDELFWTQHDVVDVLSERPIENEAEAAALLRILRTAPYVEYDVEQVEPALANIQAFLERQAAA